MKTAMGERPGRRGSASDALLFMFLAVLLLRTLVCGPSYPFGRGTDLVNYKHDDPAAWTDGKAPVGKLAGWSCTSPGCRRRQAKVGPFEHSKPRCREHKQIMEGECYTNWPTLGS